MLQLFFYVLMVSAFCIAWGLPVLFLNRNKSQEGSLNAEEWMLSFFVGLVILSVLSSWISLFAPVQYWQLLAASTPVIFIEYRWFKKRSLKLFGPTSTNYSKLHLIEISFCLVSVCLFLYLSSGKPQMEDTDLYHIQVIRWINEYGTVPGLANLYLRYGFYSNWFHLISLFNFPFSLQNFLYLNNAVCIWTFFFIFYQYKKSALNANACYSKHLSIFYFLLLLYLLFEWDLFRSASSSTSYDFIITCITLVSLHCILKIIFQSENIKFYHSTLPLLLIAAPFFKLTGLLLMPLLLIYLWLTGFKRTIIFVVSVGLLCIIPFLYKSYSQTGYLIYPYTIFNFFSSRLAGTGWYGGKNKSIYHLKQPVETIQPAEMDS